LEPEHNERHSSPQHVQETDSEERTEEPFKFTFKLFLAFIVSLMSVNRLC
jgi:hypothetical protein